MTDVQQAAAKPSAPFKRDIDLVQERISELATMSAVREKESDSAKGLAPDRHPQQDFFLANLLDVSPKDDVASMEHALYSLSKKPDREVRKFERITVTPSQLGRATVWDKDIILFCVAQLAEALNRGQEVTRTLRCQARDLLVFANRGTGGYDYELLVQGLERLAGTRIRTDIATGKKRVREGFGLIERWKLVERTSGGKPASLEIVLSEWLFNAVIGTEVLTINRDYFRLTGGLERRIYSIARKHCGQQPKFEIGMARLHEKSGSTAMLKKFRFQMRQIAAENALPDYTMEIDGKRDVLTFRPRDRAELQRRSREAAERGFTTIEAMAMLAAAGPIVSILAHCAMRMLS